MQEITLTFDLTTLKPHQHEALMALVQSLREPYVIPTSDELEADNLTQ
jgi:hypothetical protein